MSPEQIILIKQSYQIIEPETPRISALFYAKLFELSPVIEHLFARTSMSTQGQMLMQMLGTAVQNLAEPASLKTPLQELGQRHAEYGVHPEHFEIAGQALLWTLAQALGTAWTAEHEAAWGELYQFVTQEMRHGFQRATSSSQQAASLEASRSDYLALFLPPEPPLQTPAYSLGERFHDGQPLQLNYEGEMFAQGLSLQTILEISLNNSIKHVFECGGNAKCSTCRVSIEEGLENCLPRNPQEAALAQRKNFPAQIRLACQTRVTGPVKLRRLVLDSQDAQEAVQAGAHAVGREVQLAILFADLRAFTPFTEKHLPYDVVHMLNRYYNTIGPAIHEHHGYIDKYMGDGIMVLFGLNPHRELHPCVDAVNAALGILQALEQVNAYCLQYFHHEFRIGIGIHYGQAIVGEIGFHLKREFTALGDVVNMASRIESQTKEHQTSLLISATVWQNLPPETYRLGRTLEVQLPGKTGSYTLREILLSPAQAVFKPSSFSQDPAESQLSS